MEFEGYCMKCRKKQKVKELKTRLDAWLGTAVPPGNAGAAKPARPRRRRNP